MIEMVNKIETEKRMIKESIKALEERSGNWTADDFKIQIESLQEELHELEVNRNLQEAAYFALEQNPKLNKTMCALEYEYTNKEYIEAHKIATQLNITKRIDEFTISIDVLDAKIKYCEMKIKELK